MMFMITLISGLLITISSNSWLSAWMGLEINLLSFIPIMSYSSNIFTTEVSLKYFLIQALASSSLLFIILSMSLLDSMFSMLNSSLTSIVVVTPLLMKVGAAPVHWWFPSVSEGLSWENCFILMMIQKIAPLMLISHIIYLNSFLAFYIVMSVLVGTVGGYNQVSIRKMLSYSFINHLAWMLVPIMMNQNIWLMYFLFYSTLTLAIIYIIKPFQISFINQTFLINNNTKIIKFLLFTSLLSLEGLPPFLGFFPKWIVIQSMITNSSIILITVMVILSLMTLYYYLRISYSTFIILNLEPNWIQLGSLKIKKSLVFIMMVFSMTGLIFCPMLIF
uniref:NADH-ubiquinone oxidoreductase chain 2 n=1 Tax=Schultesia lampyridiformis TaxID=36965 RepID=A0A2P1H7Q5_SCHLA|nr:NADH dehydrogenase subunit 2 [Schultesia lampyridiformis]